MTWFAQKTQHKYTPVVQRLVLSAAAKKKDGKGKGKAKGSGSGSGAARDWEAEGDWDATIPRATPVLLCCRFAGEPYVYCGRLGLVDFEPARRPMRFVWRLDDANAPAMRDSEDWASLLHG